MVPFDQVWQMQTKKTDEMLGDLLRRPNGTTSNIPSPKIMEELKNVISQGHLFVNQKMDEHESRLREDLDQVAKEVQEVSQAMETLTTQMSSRAEGVTNWSCDFGRNGEGEYLPNPKRRLEDPADAPNDRARKPE